MGVLPQVLPTQPLTLKTCTKRLDSSSHLSTITQVRHERIGMCRVFLFVHLLKTFFYLFSNCALNCFHTTNCKRHLFELKKLTSKKFRLFHRFSCFKRNRISVNLSSGEKSFSLGKNSLNFDRGNLETPSSL